MILQIIRGNKIIAETADFSYSPALQEVRKLTCEVTSVTPLEFKAYNSKVETTYDTVTYKGDTFILFIPPSGENNNDAGKYKYTLLFYGKEILLQNVSFLDIVSSSGQINNIRYTHGGVFQFWGNARQLTDRIKANINTYNNSITAGYNGIGTWDFTIDVDGTLDEDMIDVSEGTNLFDALKLFYDKFNLNYYFSTTDSGGTILITNKTRPGINWTFKQGDGNGAVKISSSVDTSTPVITRIIPQGGNRNVPPDYKKNAKPADLSRYCPNILLPNDESGKIVYHIDSVYGIEHYGIRGKTISSTFSGIYPSIRGKVLGDIYSTLPEWDTYSSGEEDSQAGKVAGPGVSLSTRIDKIIGSTPIESEDDNSFFIYITNPGFNIGYKVYTDKDEDQGQGIVDKTVDVSPYFEWQAWSNAPKSTRKGEIYVAYQMFKVPVNVVATFEGKLHVRVTNIKEDAKDAKFKLNLRLVIDSTASSTTDVKTIQLNGTETQEFDVEFNTKSISGFAAKDGYFPTSIFVENTFEDDLPIGSYEVHIVQGFSACSINYNSSNVSGGDFYYKYGSSTDAVFSMRTGTYTGTEFKINKKGILPLYGEINEARGESAKDVEMFSMGARYKVSCYRTDSDSSKLPLFTGGSSQSIDAGTEFVILNIIMPDVYVAMAENSLKRAALDYLSKFDHENRTVSIEISSGFVAEHPNLFDNFVEGNMLKVRDDGIGVFESSGDYKSSMELQIQSLEIKYSKENIFPSYSCTIARRKILSFYERLEKENQSASNIQTNNVSLGGNGGGSGTNIFSESLLNELIKYHQDFKAYFEWDEEKQALKCKSALYTDQWMSVLGAYHGDGGGGSGGGLINNVYGFSDLGKTFNNTNLTDTFNAYTVNEIWKLAKEGFNKDKLWEELSKKDSTKKIDASHLPDSFVGNFVTLDTPQTITSAKIFTGELSTANIVPNVNKASTLGIVTKRWENIYTESVNTNSLQIGDVKIIYDSINKAVTFEHVDGTTKIGVYSKGWMSALGISSGDGGGSGGGGLIASVYGFSNLGDKFDDTNLTNTFNAYTINKIWELAKDGGVKLVNVIGTGNAITDMILSSDGKTITAAKESTFALSSELNSLSTKLNDFLTGSDADNIINKWKELEAFLSGMLETDNLAEILATKANSSISIIAGTGLTGGGNLTADRTLALATSGVKSGTYTKVTVDTYGRVTVGTILTEGDIPNISWSKITGKPTTLAGYGITDAYTKLETDAKYVTIATDQDITGAKRFTKGIKLGSGANTVISENTDSFDLRVTSGDATKAIIRWNGKTYGSLVISSTGDAIYFRPKGDNDGTNQMVLDPSGILKLNSIQASNFVQVGDGVIRWDPTNKALYFEHKDGTTKIGVYSKGWMSALGVSLGDGGGSGGVINTVYNWNNITDGTSFSNTDLNNTFNAYTIKKIYDLVNVPSFDTSKMWAELSRTDSSKVIDISHLPISTLDGKYVKKEGDAMTGTLITSYKDSALVIVGYESGNISNIYTDNGTLKDNFGLVSISAIRNGIRFNWYNTQWYIGNIRGESTNSYGFGIANEKHKVVLRATENETIAPKFTSTVATGTPPLVVHSTTMVNNLNAQYLDGHPSTYFSNKFRDFYIYQYNQYDYIEFMRFSINSGAIELQYHLSFDLVRTETGTNMSGRVELRIRREVNNDAVIFFYVTNFGQSKLPELRVTSDDGITYKVWVKCVKNSYDPYLSVKIVNKNNPYYYPIFVLNGTTSIPTGTKYTVIASIGGIANQLYTDRTLWGKPFNGTDNVSGSMTGVDNITMTGSIYEVNAQGLFIKDRSGSNLLWALPCDNNNKMYITYPEQGFILRNRSHVVTMFANNNGNVGIKTENPTKALVVNGDIECSMFFSTYNSATWVRSMNYAALNCNMTSFGGIWNAKTKNGRIAMATYPSDDDRVYLGYESQTAINAGTNSWTSISYFDGSNGCWTCGGYFKAGSSNDFVLLGGGGHKSLSSFQSENDGRYVNVTGDTMTGILNVKMTENALIGIYSPAGYWSYLKLNNGLSCWDIATKNDRGLEFRYNSNDTLKWGIDTGGTLSNTGGSGSIRLNQSSATGIHGIIMTTGNSDFGALRVGATGDNAGWIELATADDGTEPIYARQYNGTFTSVKNELVLLDSNGNTVMHNNNKFVIEMGTKMVYNGNSCIHGGTDQATYVDANLRFGSWLGIGWYPTIANQVVPQGENAMWLNTRDGYLYTQGEISACSKKDRRAVIASNNNSAWITSKSGMSNTDLNYITLYDSYTHSLKYITAPYFQSTVSTGTQPYRCSSTTLNANLNADMLDGFHNTYFLRGFYGGNRYRLEPWGGSTDTAWRVVVRYVHPVQQTTYQACTIYGKIWLDAGNHNQAEVVEIPFQVILYAYGGIVGLILNSSTLLLPSYCTYHLIQVVRYNNNSWELQIRQPNDWMKISFEYNVVYTGGSVTAGLFTTSDIHTSTVVNTYDSGVSRPKTNLSYGADKLNTARTINGTNFDGRENITTSYWGTARTINGTSINGSTNYTTAYWGTTRTFYLNSYDGFRNGSGTSVNGNSNVTLYLPNSIRCSDWFRSTGTTGWYNENYGGGIYMTDTNYVKVFNGRAFRTDNPNYYAFNSAGGYYSEMNNSVYINATNILNTNGGILNSSTRALSQNMARPVVTWSDTVSNYGYITRYSISSTRPTNGQWGRMTFAVGNNDGGTSIGCQMDIAGLGFVQVTGDIYATGAMTAKKSSSDIRLKKDIQSYSAMTIINSFKSVKYHWNDIAKSNSKIFNDNSWQFGLIAQDLLQGGYKQWVSDVFKDFYTIDYERLIPVVWKGLQEVDSEVSILRNKVKQLEKEVEQLRSLL